MIRKVAAAYPKLPLEAVEYLCTSDAATKRKADFQLDHYIAPLSDCIYTIVIMISFANAGFGDNNRRLAKNSYGSVLVADQIREAAVQNIRRARA